MYYVYRFLKGHTTMYVGQSKELHDRLMTHLRGNRFKGWDSIEYIEVNNASEVRNLEGFFIDKFNPAYNCKKERFDATKVDEKHLEWKVVENLQSYKLYAKQQYNKPPKYRLNNSTVQKVSGAQKVSKTESIFGDKDETISALKERLKEKEERIQLLEEIITFLKEQNEEKQKSIKVYLNLIEKHYNQTTEALKEKTVGMAKTYGISLDRLEKDPFKNINL